MKSNSLLDLQLQPHRDSKQYVCNVSLPLTKRTSIISYKSNSDGISVYYQNNEVFECVFISKKAPVERLKKGIGREKRFLALFPMILKDRKIIKV